MATANLYTMLQLVILSSQDYQVWRIANAVILVYNKFHGSSIATPFPGSKSLSNQAEFEFELLGQSPKFIQIEFLYLLHFVISFGSFSRRWGSMDSLTLSIISSWEMQEDIHRDGGSDARNLISHTLQDWNDSNDLKWVVITSLLHLLYLLVIFSLVWQPHITGQLASYYHYYYHLHWKSLKTQAHHEPSYNILWPPSQHPCLNFHMHVWKDYFTTIFSWR